MSQDILADTFNQIMNLKKAGKKELEVARYSKLLIKVLEIGKENGYLEYSLSNKKLKIKILKLNECKVIKPRFNVAVEDITKYVRRYLPSRNFGIMIISTSSGLMTHEEAYEKNLGGSLIAFYY